MGVIPIDKAVNESMLNPSILEKVVTDEIRETDEGAIIKENNETKESNEGDELEITQNGSNEIILNNDDFGDGNNDNNETINHKQVRRSERIKKRIVNINPKDIGENDNENDEDYK